MSVIPDELRISTLTAISKLSQDIDLQDLYDKLEINDIVKYIEYKTNAPKGFSKKALKKKRKKSVKKMFFNQATIHIQDEKLVNVKIFNNGNVQMTGLKSEEMGKKIVKILSDELLNKNICTKELNREYFKIVLINSDFDIKYKVNREILHRDIIGMGMCSSFEPTIYPGVNMKYFYNEKYDNNGVCKCSERCNGKGTGSGNGECKRITIAIFNSGKIIITGGRSENHLFISYNFINTLLADKNRYKINI